MGQSGTLLSPEPVSGWTVGGMFFAGVLMIVIGIFQAIAGSPRSSRTTSSSFLRTARSGAPPMSLGELLRAKASGPGAAAIEGGANVTRFGSVASPEVRHPSTRGS
jgi:hypothetical protein